MGAMSRRKGARSELEVVSALKRVFPDAHRTAPMQSLGQPKRGYADIGGTPGYHIEVGYGKQVSAHLKWEQAAEACAAMNCVGAERPVPVAVTHRDRGEVLATLRLEDLLEILRYARNMNGRVEMELRPSKKTSAGQPAR